jgi:hypothetical protein
VQRRISGTDASVEGLCTRKQHRSARTERLIKRLGRKHSLGDCIKVRRVRALNPRRDCRRQLAIARGKLFEHDFHTSLRHTLGNALSNALSLTLPKIATGKLTLIFVLRSIHRL